MRVPSRATTLRWSTEIIVALGRGPMPAGVIRNECSARRTPKMQTAPNRSRLHNQSRSESEVEDRAQAAASVVLALAASARRRRDGLRDAGDRIRVVTRHRRARARTEIEGKVQVAAEGVAKASADLAVVLSGVVVAVDVRLLHAETREDVRSEAILGTDFVEQRSAEAAIDANVIDTVDRGRGLAELALDDEAVRQTIATEETHVGLLGVGLRVVVGCDATGEHTDAELRQLRLRDDRDGRAGRCVRRRFDGVVRRAVIRGHRVVVVVVRPVVAAITADVDVTADTPRA